MSTHVRSSICFHIHIDLYLLVFKEKAKCNQREESDLSYSQAIDFLVTVNSEIFARVLFSGKSAHAEFLENKILAKWRNHCHLLM